jgi:hypothetical protein
MIAVRDRDEIIERLGTEPLANVVLLKHLQAFPQHTRAFQRLSSAGIATLVLLDTAACDYDRKTYPTAAHAALIRSGDAALTEALLSELPADSGIVFKLCCTADRDVVHRHYPLTRKTSFLSFTSPERTSGREGVTVADSATDAMYALYRMQDHERGWLSPLWRADAPSPAQLVQARNRSPSAWPSRAMARLGDRRRGHAARPARARPRIARGRRGA